MFRRKNNTHINQEHHIAYEEEKINELRSAIGPLSGRSLSFCTDPCLKRYLKGRNWNVAKSKKMLEETLKWRSSFKPEEICWNDVEHEGETGKAYRADFRDRDGRTVVVMRPGKQNTTSHEGQIRHLVYVMENAILNLAEGGQEQVVWLVDFTGWSLTSSVPMRTSRETMNILQNHYPERLAAAFLYNPPRIFEPFWKVGKVFLDPVTFKKIKFVYPKNGESTELMREHFDMDKLPEELGGKKKKKMEYDHAEYSLLMSKDDAKMATAWGIGPENYCTHTAGSLDD